MRNRNQKGMSDIGMTFLTMIGSLGVLVVGLLGGMTYVMKYLSALPI